ncbi:MAG TPA: hypothetical protein VMH06_03070 [Thermodesulfovibrionales bacterium]|nr:hypothetical protein [Thermodesulfovibrionales bacterium]
MTEKFFAAAASSCHDEIPDESVSMCSGMENFFMASDKIMSRPKDFEGINAPPIEANNY